MNWIVFEDEGTSRLYPITVGRPGYAVSCGGYRLYDILSQSSASISSIIRPHLEELQTLDYPAISPLDTNQLRGPLMFVNSRLAPCQETATKLRQLAADGAPFIAKSDGQVIAALLPEAPRGENEAAWGVLQIADSLTRWSGESPEIDWTPPMFDYPHDVVRHHMAILDGNLDHRLRQGEYEEIRQGVFAAEGVRLSDHVVSDSSDGPILLEKGASIGPYCLLNGPAYVGPGARVIEHAALKDGVSLGHTTKIGGEVEASVIEPYTNKQHYGFLGHSYLGSWINLGAGTCNSDLKNTYGLVNMHYNGAKVKTGMQFLGCIMGDYAKTAINTGIFTGKTIGVCSMAYGFVTENVPSFVNYARLFGQVAELPPEVMIATQQRMFLRRKVDQRPCDMQLIRDMFELTRFEREWSAADVLSL